MKRVKAGIVLFIIISLPVYLQAAFEMQVMGGKSAGVGNTLIVDNEGNESGFQNPAMLSYVENLIAQVVYSPVLVGIEESSINCFSGGVAYKYRRMGTLGVYYNGLSVNAFDENIYNESMVKILYGNKIVGGFSGGVSLSLLKWSAGFSMFDGSVKEEANSSLIVNLGAGIVFESVENIKIGLVVDNINTPELSTGDNLPIEFKLGLVYGKKTVKGWNVYFNLDTEENSLNYNVGTELRGIMKYFAIRSGLEVIDSGNGINFTIGGGYKYKSLRYDIVIDYGFVYPVVNLTGTLGTHIVSIGIKY